MSTDRARAHHEAIERVWGLIAKERAVVVDSPPGAGKSTLVRQLAGRLVAAGEQVPIVVQTNEQGDDLAYALAEQLAPARRTVGRLHGSDWRAPGTGLPDNLVAAAKLGGLDGCAVIVATGAKWAYVRPDEHRWELGIVDEAYQMSSGALVRVADLFDRLLLVGDPGQLSPFTIADERAIRAVSHSPLDTAAGTVLRHHPSTVVVPLPVSWRLAPHTASVVADAFYARPFVAGTAEGARALRRPPAPVGGAADEVVRTAARHGWGLLELPPAYLPRTDPGAVSAIVDVVRQLAGANMSTVDESGERPLTAADVVVGVTHRDQRAHLRSALDSAGHTDIVVDTANRLQGRQFEVMVAWHPLSGRRDASAFHLEAGRLCVLASRHRQACVIVTRGGVEEQLRAYPGREPVWLGADPPSVDGWEANLAFLRHLAPFQIRA